MASTTPGASAPPRASALSAALLVAVLLAYPFVDRLLGIQTIYAVSDGMISPNASVMIAR